MTTISLTRKTFFAHLNLWAILIKVKITRTVVFTAFLGYFFALPSPDRLLSRDQLTHCLIMLFAISLVCAGACAFNHILEMRWDKQMSRTKQRPLVTGAISPRRASIIAIVLITLGVGLMLAFASPYLALGALATVLLYDVAYTPLKRYSAWNTTLGALPGALPVFGGAVAASGTIPLATIPIFLVIFLWQHPHFYAIAWVYREDYARAGYRMLSGGDESMLSGDSEVGSNENNQNDNVGSSVTDLKYSAAKIFGFSFAITILLTVVTALLPIFMPTLSFVYTVINLLLSLWLLAVIARAWRAPLNRHAQKIITVSVFYLIGWMLILIVDYV